MARLYPVPARLLPDQIAWLDRRIQGPISSRSEALRHVLSQAMAADCSPDCLHAACPLRHAACRVAS